MDKLVPPLDDADRALLARWGIPAEGESARRRVLVGRLQRQLNYDLGAKMVVDGLWGPQSQALYDEWVRKVPYPVLNPDVEPIVLAWMSEHGLTRPPPPGEWPRDGVYRQRFVPQRVLVDRSFESLRRPPKPCPHCGAPWHPGLCGTSRG